MIAFDDLRLKTGRAARVELNAILYEGNGVIFEETLTIGRLVRGEKPKIEDVIAATATALHVAADQVSLRLQKALAVGRSASLTDSTT